MTSRVRRIIAVVGGLLAGLGFGVITDAILASGDRYLTAAYNTGFFPFRGIGSTDSYPVPTLASAIIPIAGAMLGAGIGLAIAALIPNDSE